jgi:hypothetical protein
MTPANAPQPTWRRAMVPLALSAVMVALAAALVGASWWWAQSTRQEVQLANAQLASAQQASQETQVALSKLETNLVQFDELRRNHFLGVPGRLELLDALARASSRWPNGLLQWEIQSQKVVSTINDEATGSPLAEVRVIPVKVAASNIQEEEWFSFLQTLRQSGAGYYRVDTCELRKTSFYFIRAVVPAVNAQCDLSWVFMVPTDPQGVRQ